MRSLLYLILTAVMFYASFMPLKFITPRNPCLIERGNPEIIQVGNRFWERASQSHNPCIVFLMACCAAQDASCTPGAASQGSGSASRNERGQERKIREPALSTRCRGRAQRSVFSPLSLHWIRAGCGTGFKLELIYFTAL